MGCNGTSPIVIVTRPPNFNGLVELDYNFTTDGMPNGEVGDGTYTHVHRLGEYLVSEVSPPTCTCSCDNELLLEKCQ